MLPEARKRLVSADSRQVVLKSASTAMEQVLKALVGSRLSITRRAADMRVFHFGEIRPHPRGKGTIGAHALHVQCPWRLVGADGPITGQSDRFEPPFAGADINHDDTRAGTLQEVCLAELLKGFDEATRSHVNRTNGLVVVSASSNRYGDLEIAFSGDIRLQLFPDGSTEEQWRLFATEKDAPHFVFEGGLGVVA